MSLFFLFMFGLTGSESGWPHVSAVPPCPSCRAALPPSAVKYAIVRLCATPYNAYISLGCTCVSVCRCGRDRIGLSIDQKDLCVGREAVEIPTRAAVCVCVCVGRHLAFECCFTLSIWSCEVLIVVPQHSFIGIYYSFYDSILVFRINLI